MCLKNPTASTDERDKDFSDRDARDLNDVGVARLQPCHDNKRREEIMKQALIVLHAPVKLSCVSLQGKAVSILATRSCTHHTALYYHDQL